MRYSRASMPPSTQLFIRRFSLVSIHSINHAFILGRVLIISNCACVAMTENAQIVIYTHLLMITTRPEPVPNRLNVIVCQSIAQAIRQRAPSIGLIHILTLSVF